ncbi:unnamed protein product [Hydatigera taeniaeformis]|uniref:EF-hand_2 domain-containing protein n=1 Tax=Hydatigena taeniaeformis TaxID=6205 RepID=A0A158RFB2_HYDTA|nr:unnamed protein product [Hydatigera taeniaeformis]
MTDPATSLNRQGTKHLLNRIYTTIAPLCIEKSVASNDTSAQLVTTQASEILLGWLTYILDPTNCGRLTVSGLKVALSTLATGRPIDKFTLPDCNTILVQVHISPLLDETPSPVSRFGRREGQYQRM